MDTFNRLHLTPDLRNIRIARFHLNTTEINLGQGGGGSIHMVLAFLLSTTREM